MFHLPPSAPGTCLCSVQSVSDLEKQSCCYQVWEDAFLKDGRMESTGLMGRGTLQTMVGLLEERLTSEAGGTRALRQGEAGQRWGWASSCNTCAAAARVLMSQAGTECEPQASDSLPAQPQVSQDIPARPVSTTSPGQQLSVTVCYSKDTRICDPLGKRVGPLSFPQRALMGTR